MQIMPIMPNQKRCVKEKCNCAHCKFMHLTGPIVSMTCSIVSSPIGLIFFSDNSQMKHQ